MKLALVQMRVEPGAVDRNFAHAAERVSEAAERGAEMILLPEALPFGWTYPSRDAAESIPGGKHFQFLAGLAKDKGVYLCGGLVERARTGIFNSAVLLSPQGDLILHHRKIYELGIAHECYALGDRIGVADTPFGRIGLMICADGFAPGQVISRSLALMGAQIILSPCAWAVPPVHDNEVEPYGQLWLESYGAVARDSGIWIAGCSNVGPITTGAWKGHRCIGCSLVVGPDGQAKACGSYGVDADEIIFVEVHPGRAQRAAPR